MCVQILKFSKKHFFFNSEEKFYNKCLKALFKSGNFYKLMEHTTEGHITYNTFGVGIGRVSTNIRHEEQWAFGWEFTLSMY